MSVSTLAPSAAPAAKRRSAGLFAILAPASRQHCVGVALVSPGVLAAVELEDRLDAAGGCDVLSDLVSPPQPATTHAAAATRAARARMRSLLPAAVVCCAWRSPERWDPGGRAGRFSAR